MLENIGTYLLHAAVKVAPVVGGLAFVTAVMTGEESDPLVTLWRIVLSAALGVFIALVGAIYHSMNRRVDGLEREQRRIAGNAVSKDEYDRRHEDLKEQLGRIEDRVYGRNRSR